MLLDGELKTLRRLHRIEVDQLHEAKYDSLLSEHVELVAGALQQADIIDADSYFCLLATQFDNIDLLFGEFGADDQLVRLVIVETKLFRNREAHRKVLAQALDYAERLQYAVTGDELLRRCVPEARSLLEENREVLGSVMRRGDFLVLICGDRLQPRLVALVKPFLDRRKHMLSKFELALVSLALYEDKARAEFVLVPNVVGAVVHGERDIVLTVVVTDAEGERIGATVSADAPAEARPTRRAVWTEETFFENVALENKGASWADPESGLRRLFEFLKEEQFAIQWGSGKTASFTVIAEPGGAKMIWSNSQANVSLYRAALVNVLGIQPVHDAIARLSSELGGEIDTSKQDPWLPDSFNISDPVQQKALFRFLVEIKSALVSDT